MFYLIGVNHDKAQRYPPGATLGAGHEELQKRLEEAISAHKPRVIAVEESDDTLGAHVSIPRDVALRHGIKPIFCEPTSVERSQLGCKCNSHIYRELVLASLMRSVPCGLEEAAVLAVEMAVMFPKREGVWIEKLNDYLRLDVVLVLGENHIESFQGRLRLKDVGSTVLFHGIGVSDKEKMEFECAKRFQLEYPERYRKLFEHITSPPGQKPLF